MNNKKISLPEILLVCAAVLFFIFFYLSNNQNRKVVFEQQVKCGELGKKDNDPIVGARLDVLAGTMTTKDFIYSKKLNTCLVATSMVNTDTNETNYYLHDMFTRERLATFNTECIEKKSLDYKFWQDTKCVSSLQEFNSKKE